MPDKKSDELAQKQAIDAVNKAYKQGKRPTPVETESAVGSGGGLVGNATNINSDDAMEKAIKEENSRLSSGKLPSSASVPPPRPSVPPTQRKIDDTPSQPPMSKAQFKAQATTLAKSMLQSGGVTRNAPPAPVSPQIKTTINPYQNPNDKVLQDMVVAKNADLQQNAVAPAEGMTDDDNPAVSYNAKILSPLSFDNGTKAPAENYYPSDYAKNIYSSFGGKLQSPVVATPQSPYTLSANDLSPTAGMSDADIQTNANEIRDANAAKYPNYLTNEQVIALSRQEDNATFAKDEQEKAKKQNEATTKFITGKDKLEGDMNGIPDHELARLMRKPYLDQLMRDHWDQMHKAFDLENPNSLPGGDIGDWYGSYHADDKDQKISPYFKAQLMKLTGGDPAKIPKAAEAIVDAQIRHVSGMPSYLQAGNNKLESWLHDNPLTDLGKKTILGDYVGNTIARVPYYGYKALEGAWDIGTATAGTGESLLDKLMRDSGISSSTADEDMTRINKKVDNLSSQNVNQVQGANGLDDFLSGASYMVGQMAPGQTIKTPLAALEGNAGKLAAREATATSQALSEVPTSWANNIPEGNMSMHAITGAKQGIADDLKLAILHAQSASRSPFSDAMRILGEGAGQLSKYKAVKYADNAAHMLMTMGPQMYHGYYNTAIDKGYAPHQAAEQAAKSTTLQTALMGATGLTSKSEESKMISSLLDGAPKSVAKSIIMHTAKEAATGAATFSAGGLIDQYTDFLYDREHGKLPVGAEFNWKEAGKSIAKQAQFGALFNSIHALIGGHGKPVDEHQANTIALALQDPESIQSSLKKGLSKGWIDADDAHTVNGFLQRLRPKVADYMDNGEHPIIAVKKAIEVSRLQDASQAKSELPADHPYIPVYDAQEKESMTALHQMSNGVNGGKFVSKDQMRRLARTDNPTITKEDEDALVMKAPYRSDLAVPNSMLHPMTAREGSDMVSQEVADAKEMPPPIIEGLGNHEAQIVTLARETLDNEIGTHPHNDHKAAGLVTPTDRAVYEAAQVLRNGGIPEEAIGEMVHRLTGGIVSPIAAEAVGNAPVAKKKDIRNLLRSNSAVRMPEVQMPEVHFPEVHTEESQKEEPDNQQPADEPQKVPDATPPPPASEARVQEMPLSELHLDPTRFQYKVEGRGHASGSTESIDKTVPFDHNLAGVVSVWRDPADGKVYVVNGHNRVDHSQRANDANGNPITHLDVKFIQADNAKTAREIGAKQNIAEGNGTAREDREGVAGGEEKEAASGDGELANFVDENQASMFALGTDTTPSNAIHDERPAGSANETTASTDAKGNTERPGDKNGGSQADGVQEGGATSNGNSQDSLSDIRKRRIVGRLYADVQASQKSITNSGWQVGDKKSTDRSTINGLHNAIQRLFGKHVGLVVIDNEGAKKRGIPSNVEAYYDRDKHEMVLNIDKARPWTAVHEMAHMWVHWASVDAPELHGKGLGLAKGSDEYKYMKWRAGDGSEKEPVTSLSKAEKAKLAEYAERYRNRPSAEDDMAEEVLAMGVEKKGMKYVDNNMLKRFKVWMDALYSSVRDKFGFRGMSNVQFADMKFGDFTDKLLEELTSGRALTKGLDDMTRQKAKNKEYNENAKLKRGNLENAITVDNEGDAKEKEKDSGRVDARKIIDDTNFRKHGEALGGALERVDPKEHDRFTSAESELTKALSNTDAFKNIPKTGNDYVDAHAALTDILENGMSKADKEAIGSIRKKRGIGGFESTGLLKKYFDAYAGGLESLGAPNMTGDEILTAALDQHFVSTKKDEGDYVKNQLSEQDKDLKLHESAFSNTAIEKALKQERKSLAEKGLGDNRAIARYKAGLEAQKRRAENKKENSDNTMFSLSDNDSEKLQKDIPPDDYDSMVDDILKNQDEGVPISEALDHAHTYLESKGIDYDRDALERVVRDNWGGVEDTPIEPEKAKGHVEQLVEQVQAQHKGVDNEAATIEVLTSPESNTVHGISNSFTIGEMEKLGVPKNESAKLSKDEAWQEALRQRRENPDETNLVVAMLKKRIKMGFNGSLRMDRPPSDVEIAHMFFAKTGLEMEMEAIGKAIDHADGQNDDEKVAEFREKLLSREGELKDIHTTITFMKKESSMGLLMYQVLSRNNVTLEQLVARKKAKVNRDLSDNEMQSLRDQVAELKKANNELQATHELNKKKLDEAHQSSFEDAELATKKARTQGDRTASTRTRTKRGVSGGQRGLPINEHPTQRKDSIVDRIRKQREKRQMAEANKMYSIAPSAEAERGSTIHKEDIPLLKELERVALEDDVDNTIDSHDKLVDVVHASLKKGGITDIDRRDLRDTLSEYGKLKKLNDDPTEAKLREFHELMRLQSQMDDALNGGTPLKTGLQRDKPSIDVRELRRKVMRIMKDMGIVTYDQEKQIKTSLDRAMNTMRNRMDDINRQLENGEREAASKKMDFSQSKEYTDLKAQYDDLKQVMDEVHPVETDKVAKTPEEIRISHLEKQKDSWQRQVDDLKRDEKKAGKKVTNDRIKAMETSIDILKRALDEADPKPGLTDDQIRERRAKAYQGAIDKLRSQVANGKRDLKKARVKNDAHLDELSATITDLRGKLNEVDPQPKKVLSDEEKHSIALKGIQRAIDNTQEDIANEDFSKKGVQKLDSPDIEAKRKELAALKALKVSMDKKERQFDGLSKTQKQWIKDMAAHLEAAQEGKIQASKVHNALSAQANVNLANAKIAKAQEKDDYASRSAGYKTLYFLAKLKRFNVLSYPTTLIKLTGSAVAISATTLPLNALGAVTSRLIPKSIRNKASVEAGFYIQSEAKAFARGIVNSGRDMKDVISGRLTQLELLGGHESIPEWADLFGRTHALLKSAPKRIAFEMALEKQFINLARVGIDVTDPLVQAKIVQRALIEANRAIFMEDNQVSSRFNSAISGLEQSGHYNEAQTLRILFPITKVPVNILNRSLTHIFGSFQAGFEVVSHLVHQKIDGDYVITEDKANAIMRHLKQGQVGLLMLFIGMANPHMFGASTRRKDDKEEGLSAGDMMTPFGKIDSHLLHHPLFTVAGMGASYTRLFDRYLNTHKDDYNPDNRARWDAFAKVMIGDLQKTPYSQTFNDFSGISKGADLSRYAADMINSSVVPGIIKQAAEWTDKDSEGQVVRRMVDYSMPLHAISQTFVKSLPYFRQYLSDNPNNPGFK